MHNFRLGHCHFSCFDYQKHIYPVYYKLFKQLKPLAIEGTGLSSWEADKPLLKWNPLNRKERVPPKIK